MSRGVDFRESYYVFKESTHCTPLLNNGACNIAAGMTGIHKYDVNININLLKK